MKLRDYQLDCINSLRKAISDGERNLLVKAPCSFGKTIVFCEIAKRAKEKGNKTLILMDSVFLVTQTVEKLSRFTDDIGIYCGTLKRKDHRSITVATIQSVKAKDYDLIFIDEVHSGLKRTLNFLDGFTGIVIGFTATPYNAKGEAIYGPTKFFKKLNYGMGVQGLLDRDIITPMKYGTEKEETKINLRSIPIVRGDYKESELQKVYDINKNKVELQVEDMLSRVGERNKVIIMTTGIDHANFIASILPGSLAYHSEVDQKRRSEILEEFEHGGTKFLIGVMAIYKGLDITSVDCIVNMRPTRSKSFYVQLCGRGVRKHPGKKDALLLDYGQTVDVLGFYEDITEVPERNRHKALFDLRPKKCPKCMALVKQQTKTCECGYIFQVITTDNLTKEAFTRKEPESYTVTSVRLYPEYSEKAAKIEVETERSLYSFYYARLHTFGRMMYSSYARSLKIGSKISVKKNNKNYWEIDRIWNGN